MKRFMLFLFLTGSFSAAAQYTLKGKVTDAQGEGISGVQVELLVKDSLQSIGLTDGKGDFILRNIGKGTYRVTASYPGFDTITKEEEITGNTDLKLIMKETKEVHLNEVVVNADRSDVVKRTATGYEYYLSKKARNSGDPYVALREIPELVSDPGLQSVRMVDGGKVLVLIDGNEVNSGITPIDPKDIASVEVDDVVGARYLKKGVKHVLNIKLKKNRAPYVFFQAMTRHDIPLRESMAAVYFEVGNPRFSLFGRTAGDFIFNDGSRTESWQEDTEYYKRMQGRVNNNDRNGNGELLFKFKLGEKDYLVAHLYDSHDLAKTAGSGNGTYRTEETESFYYDSRDRNLSDILTGTLYEKHVFGANKILETTLAYNRNRNDLENFRKETYPSWLYSDSLIYRNNRTSGNLNIDYSWALNKVSSLDLGSTTDYVSDRIDKQSEGVPVFLHRQWDEYLYASFGSKLGKHYYMASAGLEGIYLKAGDSKNHYIKPRVSASDTYTMDARNSVNGSYTLTNQAPTVGQLNPYNTSTDSLVETKGNPNLLPEEIHQFNASYHFMTRGQSGFWIIPSATYEIHRDLIEDYGYSDKGIFVNTYRNMGHYRTLQAGGQIGYWFKQMGQVYVGAYHNVSYFTGMKALKSFSLAAGLYFTYGKWQFWGDIQYKNYEYTPISWVRQITPSYSSLMLNYNFTKDFYIGVALPYFIGTLSTKTVTGSGTYSSYLLNRMTDRSAHPWILLRYTIRRHVKQKMELDNTITSKEKGIKL